MREALPAGGSARKGRRDAIRPGGGAWPPLTGRSRGGLRGDRPVRATAAEKPGRRWDPWRSARRVSSSRKAGHSVPAPLEHAARGMRSPAPDCVPSGAAARSMQAHRPRDGTANLARLSRCCPEIDRSGRFWMPVPREDSSNGVGPSRAPRWSDRPRGARDPSRTGQRTAHGAPGVAGQWLRRGAVRHGQAKHAVSVSTGHRTNGTRRVRRASVVVCPLTKRLPKRDSWCVLIAPRGSMAPRKPAQRAAVRVG